MKRLVQYIVLGILIANAAFWMSCSGFEEMNEDPNKVRFGHSTPTKLLQDIIYSGHWYIFYQSYHINGELMQYSVYFSSSNRTSTYVIRATDPLGIWRNLYRWSSAANHMYKMAADREDPNSMAIALTLKVYIMESLTACFGDVPYSQAMLWDEIPAKPEYDAQLDIYTSLIDELRYANSLYDLTKTLDYPDRDLLYGGQINKWQKFTNSLRLRLLMRVSKCTEIDAPAMMQDMIDNPSVYPMFAGNADAAILRYTGVTPFYNQFGTMGGYDVMSTNSRLGKTLLDLMNPSGDPRVTYYARPQNGVYEGLASGQDADYIAANIDGTCTFNANLSTNTSPSTLMNYAEVLFLKSEAAFRGFITGDPETYFNDGVTASIRQWSGNESYNATSFISHETVRYNGTVLRIMEQKYISQFLSGFEAWCDYRRTGMPAMPVGPVMENRNEAGVATLPTRLVYPAITQSANAANYRQAVERMGGKDDMLTKVWWAQGTRY